MTERMMARPARRIRLPHALVVVLMAGLVAGGGASGATTEPTFARADYSLFGNNYVVGDFTGDGSLDLAGVGTAANVRLNNGAGTFGAVVGYAIGGQGQDIAAGDFTGDGRLDLVVTINNPQIGLSLLTGNGDGTFASPVNFPNTSGFDSPAVAAVDLNNDGKLDVVVAHQIACHTAPCVVTDLISVLIGNGNGTFQPSREIPVGRGMSEIAVGDYNRDGFKDLAIGGTQGQVYRLYGVGDGTFVQQPTLTAVVDQSFIPVTDIDIADFNGDSIQDLVAAVPHNGSRTAILIGNGDGTFGAPLVLTDPGLRLPQQQAVADYNGDGFQDLALSLGDGNQGVMQIRNGNGDGTFQAPVQYLVPPPTSSVGGIFIVSANLNGDT
jgi:FG-GAP-like repeat